MWEKEKNELSKLSDLELCKKYVEECRQFINPLMFNAVNGRGLTRFIDFLPRNKEEAHAVLYSRFAKAGKCFGDPEIDAIAGLIEKTERLQDELFALKITEVEKRIPIMENLLATSIEIKDYFKSNKVVF